MLTSVTTVKSKVFDINSGRGNYRDWISYHYDKTQTTSKSGLRIRQWDHVIDTVCIQNGVLIPHRDKGIDNTFYNEERVRLSGQVETYSCIYNWVLAPARRTFNYCSANHEKGKLTHYKFRMLGMPLFHGLVSAVLRLY